VQQRSSATGLGTPALAHNLALGVTSVTITPFAGFLIEAVLAFFLVTIVANTAVAGRARNFAPLAIGMTVTFNIITGRALTGRRFQPGAGAGANDRNGQLQQCVALPDGSDYWRTHRCLRAYGPHQACPGTGSGGAHAQPDGRSEIWYGRYNGVPTSWTRRKL
jgi:hypothetical protein